MGKLESFYRIDSTKNTIIFFAFLTFLYSVLLYFIFPRLQMAFMPFGALFISAAAWQTGLKRGLVYAFIQMAATGTYMKHFGTEVLIQNNNIFYAGVGLFISFVTSVIIGWTSDLYLKTKQQEKVLQEANEKLTILDKKKDEFISVAAHELKTPLTSIKGFTEILLDKKNKKTEADKTRFLTLIHENANRLQKLIFDLVDSSRISLGRIQVQITAVDVYDIFREVKSNMGVIIKEKGLNSKFLIEKDLPEIKADKERVLQVISNLITNAVKYTEKGSVEFRVYRDGNHVVFRVSDTGVGIPDKFKSLIFTKFYQVDGSFTTKFGGSGLGLSICKGLVEFMKGGIWFESVEGKGSVFYFKIPTA